MTAAPWPGIEPTWLEAWAVWYLRGKTGPRPSSAPTGDRLWIGWQFLQFYLWRASGGLPSKRPASLPATIPAWAFAAVKRVKASLAPKPAPGAPPFRLPLVFTAWGFTNGTFTPDALAETCTANAVGTVALQIGQVTPDASKAFHARGIDVAAWGIAQASDRDAVAAFEADAYMPQIEGMEQYALAEEQFDAGVGRGIGRAVVTTLGVTGQALTDLIAKGVSTAFVECYGADGWPHADLARMLWQAQSDGWPFAVPVVGIYGGFHLGDYDLAGRNRQFGVWLAEELGPADWQAIRDSR